MIPKNTVRLDRLLLLVAWLLGCYIFWSPHTGARISSRHAERTEYGFAGYYSVTLTHSDGHRVGSVDLGGLFATVIGTSVWSLYLAWLWRRSKRSADMLTSSTGMERGTSPTSPADGLSKHPSA
jgi:hypothetical protein